MFLLGCFSWKWQNPQLKQLDIESFLFPRRKGQWIFEGNQQSLPLRATCFFIQAQCTQSVFWGHFGVSFLENPRKHISCLIGSNWVLYLFFHHSLWGSVCGRWSVLRALSWMEVGAGSPSHIPGTLKDPWIKRKGHQYKVGLHSMQPSFHYLKNSRTFNLW